MSFRSVLLSLSLLLGLAGTARAGEEFEDRGILHQVVLGGRLQLPGGRLLRELQVTAGPPGRSGRLRSYQAFAGDRAVVQLAAGAEAAATFARLGVAPVKPLMPAAGLWLVRDLTPGDAVGDAPAGLRLAARLTVELGGALRAAVPDLYLARTKHAMPVPPDDPRYGSQWYLDHIDIEQAWARTTGNPATGVVVIDDGCDLAHPDLRDQLDPGLDALDEDDDPSYEPNVPGNSHGTACAGIIAARGNNGVGIAGACPECRLRCVRLLGQIGTLVPISADVAAFQFALEQGAAVVSNSWGYVEAMPVPTPIRTAIEAVFDQGRGGLGALVVFAAGNDDRELFDDEITAVRGVINVGAINNFDEAAPFSNFGPSLDLTAPTGTVTTDISGPDGDNADDYTDLFGGTSSACPVVAGVAGLLFSAHPEATAQQVADALLTSTRPAPFATPDASGHDPLYGYGIVDPAGALAALDQVLGGPPVDGGPGDDGGGPADATPAADTAAADAVTGGDGAAADGGVVAPAGGCSLVGGEAPADGALALLTLLAAMAAAARPRRPRRSC